LSLAAEQLSASVNFDGWFQSHLLRDLEANAAPSDRILRARAVQLVGVWVPFGCSAETRALVYAALLRRLQPDEDLAVRLLAAAALREVVDDWNFDAAGFTPFLDLAVRSLTQL